MKPLKLEMKAFGSYVNPIELDFEKNLAGKNLFLIHGATGSGKTTILDAMCYALYGESSGGLRKDSMMRSVQVGADEKTEVKFTFSLGDKVYKIIRTPGYMRKKFRGSGEVEERATAEIYVDGKFVETKNVTQYVQQLLHFTGEQFRQVIVLPQGDFRKFLSSSSNERAEVLNVMFNAGLYEIIEQGLKKKAAESKSAYDKLREQRNYLLNEARTFGNVPAETGFNEKMIPGLISETEKIFFDVQKKIDETKKISDAATQALTDGKILNGHFENLEKCRKNLSAAKTDLADTEKSLSAAKIEYDKRKDEEPIRRDADKKIEEAAKIKKSFDELRQKQKLLKESETEENLLREKLRKSELTRQKGEERLEQRKREEESLRDAGAKLKDAEKKFEQSENREKRLNALKKLLADFDAAQKLFDAANKNYETAKKNLEQKNFLQKAGFAAKLAATLEDGKPCPVCGSTSHPKIAVSEEIIPTDEEISNCEKILRAAEEKKSGAEKNSIALSEKIKSQENEIKNLADVLPLSDAKILLSRAKEDAAKLEKCRENLKVGEKFLKENAEEIDRAKKNLDEKSKATENLRGIVKEKKNSIPAEYFDDPEKIETDLKKFSALKKELNDAWTIAEKNFHALNNKKSAHEEKVKNFENAEKDVAEKISGKEKPDLDALTKNFETAKKEYENILQESVKISERLKNLRSISDKLGLLVEQADVAEKEHGIWQKLSDAAEGKNSRISFRRYYLNAMFKEIIYEANARLDIMTDGRYQFREGKQKTDRRRGAGLDLKISDMYNGRERDVETLSGGESFLASLSLALGLAAVVKNISGGIRLDSIFIDEGFGSLDSETLDTAMNALTDLQQGGRLVGIISHVGELRQRISTRLEVTAGKNGSTAKFI